MNLIGIGVISLIVYIVSIIFINTVLKRKMAESMMWSFILLLIISQIFQGEGINYMKSGLEFSLKQEVIFAAMAFSYMSYVMTKTGIVSRLVDILNSLIGRLPGGSGYVSTIASALFGMISGSGSGNAAAVGSITIPWMTETGWSKEDATTIVAGNAGLGMVFPPSSSMFLLLGMPTIAPFLTSSELYITLMSAALIILAYRLVIVRYFVGKSNIKGLPKDSIPSIGVSMKNGWQSLLIFLGVLTPILLTSGPISKYLESVESFGAAGLKSISLILWVPILISIIAIIEGRKFLPNTVKGWIEFNQESVSKFGETGALLFFAFAASRVLINLGLETEITAIFEHIANLSPILVVISIAVLITMMVGPFTGTATTTAVGSVGFIALTSIGLAPAVACTVLLILFSNEGCIPPNSAPIYISCGISGIDNPSVIFKPLIFLYAAPTILIAMLIALKIIPLIH